MELLNKNIIFICPMTFGYEKEIASELKRMGANVYYRNDRPFEIKIVKVLVRLFPKFSWLLFDLVFYRWFCALDLATCDYVFVVRGEGLSPKILKYLREKYSSAKMILYLWDSVKNIRKVKSKFIYFDKVLSYDPLDCKKYEGLVFRPLFYIPKYSLSKKTINSNVFFVGTLHSDRAEVIFKLNQEIVKNRYFDYNIFIRSRIEYFLKFLFDKYIKKLDAKKITFKAMSADVINQKYSECSAVVDIEHPNNTGLTIRTFEVLASGKKLITTNSDIVNYDFFHPSQILVIDRYSPTIGADFFDGNFTYQNAACLSRYTLNSWVRDVFGLSQI
jgi:hypothetical protein